MARLSVDQALLKARSHAKKGKIEEAQKLYQMVLEAFPHNKRARQGLTALNQSKQSNDGQGPPQEAINQLANLYNQGQLAAVIEQATPLTEQYPGAFIVWNILGAANKGLNRLVEASEAFRKVTELNPHYADGFNNLGVILQDQRKLDEAIASYNKALAIKPDYADAYFNMGVVLQEQGKLDKAITSYNKTLAIKPDYAGAYNNKAAALKDQGKLDEAIEAYKKVLAVKPDYAEAYYSMGGALKDQGKLKEAIEAYNKALAIKPDYAEAYNNMGVAIKEQGKFDQAIESYNKALAIKPEYAKAHNNIGTVRREQGKLDQAMEAYSKALAIKPDYAEAYFNMGAVLQEQGSSDEAVGAYKKALAIKPDYVGAHRNLSFIIKYNSDHPHVTAVEEMMKRSDLDDDDRSSLHYTFAKMNEDMGKLDVAFENYVAGGALIKKLLAYDLKQDQDLFSKIKDTAPKLKDALLNPPVETTPHTPIFILGMPRSGTTLVEQIISSHSQVHGAGELRILHRLAAPLNFGNQKINSDSIYQVRMAYFDELEKVSSGSIFVTDKLPHNFLHIGLILKAFPEAKIIHVKRCPAATCWSNFKSYFALKGLGYSYNLEDTVRYFKLYQDMMCFWEQQYAGQIYHLDYDRLTVEQEHETKKLMELIELEWEDACLSPHENKRSVRTVSQQQVREKVYTGSSDAWRKFEPYLNGVFDKLGT